MALNAPHRKFFFVWVLLAVFIPGGILSGCVSTRPGVQKAGLAVMEAESEKLEEISRLNQQLFASANVNPDPSDYLLGPGDLLHITVFEAKDLDSKVRVSSRGYITLPLIGQVQLKGLSAWEAEQHIENLFREKYIKDPHVSIFVEEHFSQRVTVVGQVKNPGTYDYYSKLRLLDVMALAGGLSDNAGPTVQVRRMGDESAGQNMFIVDIVKLVKEGMTELNIEINGGDVIFVPEAGVFFVDGAVRKPGSYPIKERMVVREALLAAGGLAPYAVEDRVMLYRFEKDGGRKAYELDLTDPANFEVEVLDRDILIAESSRWGLLVQGTGINVGIPGIFGFGYRSPER